MSLLHFFVWEANAHVGGDSNAAVGSAMPRVIALLYPCSVIEVVDVDVVQPDILEVLATYDEETVAGDG